MRRIVLFRFHQNQVVCRNRLDLLRQYNPGIPIYGLYGGDEAIFPKVARSIGPEFSHLYCLSGKSPVWKWLNGDLAMREWHGAVGKEIEFDMLHLVEWDLLLLDSLDRIYSSVPRGGVGVTALIPLRLIADDWGWTQTPQWVAQWEKLLAYSRARYGYAAEPQASLGPGLCLPKPFLDLYAACDVPPLCHDEVRLPLFAQSLDFKLYDTTFYRAWFNEQEETYFNCINKEIRPEVIHNELKEPMGRRAFHPYRQVYEEPQAEFVGPLDRQPGARVQGI
jgi:hypothetical protein